MKRIICFSTAMLILALAQGQATFQKIYGGAGIDYGYTVEQTNDGGYAIFGIGFASLIKTDSNGDTLWTKTYNGGCFSGAQTTDGGYIICGGNILTKTDLNGNMLWTKNYGGTFFNGSVFVVQTTDGGYLTCGDVVNNTFDIHLIKTDSNGNSIWTKTYGNANGGDDEESWHISKTNDGGYVLTGYITTNFGDRDVYLLKTDANGDTLWTKKYGGLQDDLGYSVKQTADGGYVIGATTLSSGAGNEDAYLLKVNSNGTLQWSKTYGGTGTDEGHSVEQTSDGGFILSGITNSFGFGGLDIYLIRTNANGDTLWTKTYGDAGWEGQDGGGCLAKTSDGGFAIVGSTTDFGASGPQDVYLIKTDSLGNSPKITTAIPSLHAKEMIRIFPNPFSQQTTFQTDVPFVDGTLTIDNCFGQAVAQLNLPAWQAGNTSGRSITFNRGNLASGVYFVRLSADNNMYTGKLVIVDK